MAGFPDGDVRISLAACGQSHFTSFSGVRFQKQFSV